ncbi:polyketide synthase [Nocardia wallacei]|uniref:beta-ketoacyl [acyl carrier protein] synthase domain-containing protein n=1 Tax=Nocardia wallacei TaxID=480035 RepID=UPI00245731F0|nr:polyketide synthase [Nocardia wallacei]
MAASVEAESDCIVITGIGVEAPGDVDDLPSFWEALAGGRELIGPFPRDRGWRLDGVGAASAGSTVVPDAGGFLSEATRFDPEFFGIRLSEARVAMDPQQWVALRVAWRALENAGVNPGKLKGEACGSFVGASYNEHQGRSGMTLAAISGRISHCLGLYGPAISVDTACASGLTALHSAAAAIRDGDCEWALAGAVCVMGQPSAFFESAKVNGLATDGHCRSFAEGASGTVWAEGAAVVVLERESRARRLGHRVYGRILASQVNHNGSGRRIILPSATAQERLIRQTIERAGIGIGDVGLIEGHGAATRAGDSVEITALQQTYGSAQRHHRGGPVLGSVKSNLGHTQAAAGMLGLVKMLLCGARGAIAPSVFSENPTTKVDWAGSNLRLAAELEPWQPHGGLRYGAISSFGLAGTNAHLLLAMPELEQ